MPYVKRTWVDNDPTKPLSAARMNAIEGHLEEIYKLLGPAAAAPTGGTATATLTNLYRAPQQVDQAAVGAPELQPIAAQPQAKWLLGTETAATIAGLATAAAGKTLQLCVYAIPGRDNGQYSAGGLSSRDAYLAFMQTIVAGVGTAPALVFFEPDALGFASQLTGSIRTERLTLIRDALAILAAVPTLDVYADIALWAIDPAAVLAAVNVAAIDGFCINVSGYDSQAECYTFGDQLVTSLANAGAPGKTYIIDSSRNGAGKLQTGDADSGPWFATNQPWCNPPGRWLGVVPGTTDAAHPACRGSLWIKAPGESDGSFPTINQSPHFGESAPAAGRFWPAYARELLGLTPYTQGIPDATKVFGLATTNFTAWGPLVNRSAGTALVSGRGRINLTTAYESAGTNAAWSLVGSKVELRVYPAPAPSGATTAETSIQVESTVEGRRLRIVIDTATNQIRYAAENGYYDETAVAGGFDSAQMAFVRIRETGGKLYFETSPDRTSWTTRRTMTTPSWISSQANQRLVLTAHASTAGTYAEFDDLNT